MRAITATILGVLILLLPAQAAGQTTLTAGHAPAESTFLRSREFASLVVGKKLEITTASGLNFDGIVDSVSASGLNLVQGSFVQTVAFDQIVRLQRPSYRVRYSVLVGLLGGSVLGAFALGSCGDSACFVLMPSFIALGGGVGAAVGGILNAIRGHRDVVFMVGRRAMTLAFAPIVTHTRKAVTLAISWR